MVGRKIQKLISENAPDPDRILPSDVPAQPHFSLLPWETQRSLIESFNTGRKHRSMDVRRIYPDLQAGMIDPHRQKICPVCRMIIQRESLKHVFQGMCPRCGCRISF